MTKGITTGFSSTRQNPKAKVPMRKFCRRKTPNIGLKVGRANIHCVCRNHPNSPFFQKINHGIQFPTVSSNGINFNIQQPTLLQLLQCKCNVIDILNTLQSKSTFRSQVIPRKENKRAETHINWEDELQKKKERAEGICTVSPWWTVEWRISGAWGFSSPQELRLRSVSPARKSRRSRSGSD